MHTNSGINWILCIWNNVLGEDMDNYIMFFVDIKYGVGSPGKDALECILSGCRALAKAGIVDTNKSI